LAAFAIVETRVRQPLVNVGLFVARPFAAANLCVFAYGFSLIIVFIVVPQLAAAPTSTGYGLGLSTTGVGLVLLPAGLASVLGGLAGGRAVRHVGPRALVAAGSASAIAGCAFLALADVSTATLAIGAAAVGLAFGLTLTPVVSVIIASAAHDRTSIAVAVNTVTRNTGSAIGSQAAVAVIAGGGLVGIFRLSPVTRGHSPWAPSVPCPSWSRRG
jgi:MFS family permease